MLPIMDLPKLKLNLRMVSRQQREREKYSNISISNISHTGLWEFNFADSTSISCTFSQLAQIIFLIIHQLTQ